MPRAGLEPAWAGKDGTARLTLGSRGIRPSVQRGFRLTGIAPERVAENMTFRSA